MSGTHLRTLLESYGRAHRDEAAVVGRIDELVGRHAACFERTCLPGHVTGGAWISSPDGAHCVILHHGKLDRWLQPGGHSDGDPRTEQVAEREAREETGLASLRRYDPAGRLSVLDLDVHPIPARGNEPQHEHHDVRFLFLADPGEQPVCSDESHEVLWVPVSELESYTDEESVLRLARKAAAWLR